MVFDHRGGTSKLLKVGFVWLAVVSIILAGTIALVGHDRLKSLYRSTMEKWAGLLAVRTAIQARYDAQSVAVLVRGRLSRKDDTRNMKPVLRIELVNPSFFDENLGKDGLAQKAQEIASLAKTTFPSPDDFGVYEVVVSTRASSLVTMSWTRSFAFRAEDLPPPLLRRR